MTCPFRKIYRRSELSARALERRISQINSRDEIPANILVSFGDRPGFVEKFSSFIESFENDKRLATLLATLRCICSNPHTRRRHSTRVAKPDYNSFFNQAGTYESWTVKTNPRSLSDIEFRFRPRFKGGLAAEIVGSEPNFEIHYFGGGIDYDFAVQNQSFSEIYFADTDSTSGLTRLLPVLQKYDFVFSVLNFGILPLWDKTDCPLYLTDSLAWMWSEPPAGLENVSAYFVQNFLVSPERLDAWGRKYHLIPVPPIEKTFADVQDDNIALPRENRLLVNFSGCSNPFVEPEKFEKYVSILSRIIIEESADRFDEIQFCCSQELVDFLRGCLKTKDRIRIDQLRHSEFLRKLRTSRFLLTSPGITSTLEAVAAKIPFAFLLPQNDSQALASEIYRRKFGDEVCMAFSSFGVEFASSLDLIDLNTASLAVRSAATAMESILTTKTDMVRDRIRLLVNSMSELHKTPFFGDAVKERVSDQQVIAEHLIGSVKTR